MAQQIAGAQKTRTIRVLFANCPRLDRDACAYLILAQNAVQSVFEFEVDHLFIHALRESMPTDVLSSVLRAWAERSTRTPWRKRAERRYCARADRKFWPPLSSTIPLTDWRDLLVPYVERHKQWLSELPVQYGNWAMKTGPTVILTETALSGDYLSIVGEEVALINLAGWDTRYAPPSVIEYALFSVLRASLRMAINHRIGSHYATRGCIWDFAAHQPDARHALVGSLCSSCRTLVQASVNDSEMEQIDFLLSHKWIGKTEDAGSVASTLKRVFGYDLAVTRGLHATFFERFREDIPSATVTLIAGAIGGLVTILIAWLKQHRALP